MQFSELPPEHDGSDEKRKGNGLDGDELVSERSNPDWECDQTPVDLLLVDQYEEPLDRPWLTAFVDPYSRCIIGFKEVHTGVSE